MKNLLVIALLLVCGTVFGQAEGDTLKSYIKITITKTNSTPTKVKEVKNDGSFDMSESISDAIEMVKSDSTVNKVEVILPMNGKMFISDEK